MFGISTRFLVRAVGAVLASLLAVLIFGSTPASAIACDMPFNGTFTATSDGQWAMTRDSYHDEKTVVGTWTVTTTCSDYIDCSGTVASDQGWTGNAVCDAGTWTVTHEIPSWQPCADGTSAPGTQKFMFVSTDNPNEFTGWDKTVGPSGACGKNQWLTIRMPFKLNKIG
jgi:hypothetical protein